MRYKATCCGVVVVGRLVWIALGVTEAEEVCPCCEKWAKFVALDTAKKLVFGEKAA